MWPEPRKGTSLRDSKLGETVLLDFGCQASNWIADSSLAPSRKCTPQYNERATFGQAFLAQHYVFVNETAGLDSGFFDRQYRGFADGGALLSYHGAE